MNGQERLQLEKSKSDSSRNFTFVLKRRVEESERDTKSQREIIKQNFLRTKIQEKASLKKKKKNSRRWREASEVNSVY